MTKFEVPVLEGTIASPWGPRKDPMTGQDAFHYGIDFSDKEGAAILAARPGVVAEVGSNDVRGNYVIVKADSGGFDHYWHLQRALITKSGLRVSSKQALGLMGKTGRATGPHLHFETRPTLDTPNGGQIEPGPFVGIRVVQQNLDAHLTETPLTLSKGAVVGNIATLSAAPIVIAALLVFSLTWAGILSLKGA